MTILDRPLPFTATRVRPEDKLIIFNQQGELIFEDKALPTGRSADPRASYYCLEDNHEQRYLALRVHVDKLLPIQSGRPVRQALIGLSPLMQDKLLLAYHLHHWLQQYRYCHQCASSLVDSETERARLCPQCALLHYPRISPCVIVAVRRGRRLLLVRGHQFPSSIYSTIAGFIEPGESCEQAVVREILEETGISVKNVAYFATQAWPFPDRLMLGYTADYQSGEIHLDKQELADARWFHVDEIPNMPFSTSISHQLIDYQKQQMSLM